MKGTVTYSYVFPCIEMNMHRHSLYQSACVNRFLPHLTHFIFIDEDIEHFSELTKRGELDVDHLPFQILSGVDSDGNSLLMIAVQENQPDTVEGLLKAGIPQAIRDMPSREVS